MRDAIINIPDIGSDSATVVEICVKKGDKITKDDSIIVLESDKASMEVPAPQDGVVADILLKIGDQVSEGSPMIALNTTDSETSKPVTDVTSEATAVAKAIKPVVTPDIGADSATVIEVCVKIGDQIEKEDSLITLESDKATMEVPSPYSGKITKLQVKTGDEIGSDIIIAEIETTDQSDTTPAEKPTQTTVTTTEKTAVVKPTVSQDSTNKPDTTTDKVHAGPAVRKLAREFGLPLTSITGTGPKSRILKEDLHNYVKNNLDKSTVASGIPPIPSVDFSKWGEIETTTLPKLKQIAATNFQRACLNIPHVTQFDKADITELEAFRKNSKKKAEEMGIKLTPLAFIVKACACLLVKMPEFNTSLATNNQLIYKKYVNIGIAVDTPEGLLVPVVKNVDKLSIFEVAKQCSELAGKARKKRLKPDEMQGGCFTISSLGSIGGTLFTPIINAPEVAILGLSKSEMQPVWNGTEFIPRLILPLSLSYDHRVINGVLAAQFTTTLAQYLADIRNLLL